MPVGYHMIYKLSIITLIAVLFIGGLIPSALAAEQNKSTIHKMSDYINGNWWMLLIIAIVFIVLGFALMPFLWVGIILIILILLNWVLLSPMLQG
jgi:predicted CDP-diglyceride synthetase/phosphatidate cytidylyltransferase